MRLGRAGVLFVPFLVLTGACGSRVQTQSATDERSAAALPDASGQPAAGVDEDETFLRRQLEERDREIARLRNEVEEVRAQDTQLRASLEKATSGTEGKAARANAAGSADAVVAALQAALSQEQERRRMVETQLARLKEETSAVYRGARVPEADYLALKQELVQVQQMLADERAARERLAAETHPELGSGTAAAEPVPPPTTNPEVAELQARLDTLQEQRDAIEESLNRNLTASQKRVAELEEQVNAARTAPPPAPADAAAVAVPVEPENPSLRAQLDDEHRRVEELLAKLKAATRVSDLIFKIQAQQNSARQSAPAKQKSP